jgi:predicted O-methyltransferase YrrM
VESRLTEGEDIMILDRFKELGWRLAAGFYALRLRRASRHARDVDALLDIAFKVRLGPLRIRPMQIRSEIRDLLLLLASDPPHSVVEIGTARGGTLFLLSQVAAPDATVISIDLPGGPFGRGYPKWKEVVYRGFSRSDQRMILIRGDSQAPENLASVRGSLPHGRTDFLLIDGDHSYAGVAADFASYSPLVRPGGWIAFHDIRPANARRVGGVPRFWLEVREHFEYRELLAEGSHDGFGIGLLRVQDTAPRERNGR